jgi:cytochrome oxidase Cu insertion factor (SCO1/SenC/PrrC family)
MLMADTQTATGNQNNRFVLWALVAVFALPVVCSWVLILNPGLLPERYSNHGLLIQPPVALPAVTVHRMNGTAFSLAELHGKWTFLMAVDAACTESCKELVHQLQQIRRATGEDRTHVELLMLYKTDSVTGDLSVIKKNTGMIVAGLNMPEMEIIATALQQAGVHERPGLVVVDPMGNMVMHYPVAVTGKDILQDIRKLLRATHDWLTDMPEKPDGSV